VHEELGVAEFRKEYFQNNPVYLDPQRQFFTLLGNRWLGLSGFFDPSVWKNVYRARAKNVSGNMEGEGRLLGGVLVIGPHDQGIVFEYHEEVWGDHAQLEDILEACRQINRTVNH